LAGLFKAAAALEVMLEMAAQVKITQQGNRVLVEVVGLVAVVAVKLLAAAAV
jgi:hypothetical protein